MGLDLIEVPAINVFLKVLTIEILGMMFCPLPFLEQMVETGQHLMKEDKGGGAMTFRAAVLLHLIH
jgi:hypothetical protein